MPPAMVLGTFTSVSLHPPLVGFLAAKSSSTWPLIRPSGWLCVNVLAADQLRVSLRFTAKHPLRWDVPHRFRPSGAPQLLDALAWIDGQIAAETDAGDHWFVSVHVRSLDIQRVTEPLLFVRGSYAAPRPLAGGVTPLGTA
ncbi:MAG TPA: flavin reductase family protein [Kineosporiaceae bacterium]